AVLGWMANERRKEADIQRREAEAQRKEADSQRKEADTQRVEADSQRKSAVDARGVAENEKRQAIATLAASDFQEGINRLANPTTARVSLAYLARAARAGHAGASTRIWTLFQQRSFWLPDAASTSAPVVFQHHL